MLCCRTGAWQSCEDDAKWQGNCSGAGSPRRGPRGSRRRTVARGDVVLAQVFEREALLNGLERQGLVTPGEVLEEIKRPKEKPGTASQTPPGCRQFSVSGGTD
jgi:hypothetical protein